MSMYFQEEERHVMSKLPPSRKNVFIYFTWLQSGEQDIIQDFLIGYLYMEALFLILMCVVLSLALINFFV